MYDSLRTSVGSLTDANLTDYFKQESFGVTGPIERTEQPAAGVTIQRDAFGVPHIFGVERSDAMFGAGYVTAEDRLFMADVLRHLGRGRLSEFLGASPENVAMDESVYAVAGYSEAEMQAQIQRLFSFGSAGAQVVSDATAFIHGLNARIQEDLADPSQLPAEYPALQIEPTTWKPTDLVAVATLIQAIFAGGGGGELSNAVFLKEEDTSVLRMEDTPPPRPRRTRPSPT